MKDHQNLRWQWRVVLLVEDLVLMAIVVRVVWFLPMYLKDLVAPTVVGETYFINFKFG
jgi:hypothetical protein